MGDGEEEGEEMLEDLDSGEQYQTEITFLSQFPQLSVFFKNNDYLFKTKGRKKGFEIMKGGFIPPTCCSMLINCI